MKLLFVKADKIGSRIIRWGLRSDCSHFAICFDEDSQGSGIVFHSYGRGTQLEWLGEFMHKYAIVHALEFRVELTLEDEESIYRELLRLYSGKRYDYPALLWWAWRGLLWRVANIPFGSKNRWSQKAMLLCTGIARGIKWIQQYADEKNIDLEMISPCDLRQMLIDSGYFTYSHDWRSTTNSIYAMQPVRELVG